MLEVKIELPEARAAEPGICAPCGVRHKRLQIECLKASGPPLAVACPTPDCAQALGEAMRAWTQMQRLGAVRCRACGLGWEDDAGATSALSPRRQRPR